MPFVHIQEQGRDAEKSIGEADWVGRDLLSRSRTVTEPLHLHETIPGAL